MKPEEQEQVEELMAEYQADLIEQSEKTAPQYHEKDNQFKLIRDVLDTEDSKKVANLSAEEIGRSLYTVRGCLNLSLLCNTLDQDITRAYWESRAEVINATSMSKKATFLNLIFTQIRKTIAGTSGFAEKKGLFNWGKKSGDR